ncbi:hypothetical protein P175DRAFT_0523668 [Aspergillus ochraceoroseus IBT 24754]|uniref:Telomere replication protein EST3 n=2 Tax=Aspergillus ochraceoroseus TaxID=138278 RepID=A0A2T5LWZ4_9EURO|nr:uncharacterized protein P175DRAFT_0523668 [Aspergillus ochraceoroseus IBT 24754]KKK20804.1 hypothetical protein AOCH_007338 [Aspergillus ochraceoroseus]PTU20804.1 hypothetical protein P175DRAFT_0523668 [Aspergillus ochraceoroseus IBT 24754]
MSSPDIWIAPLIEHCLSNYNSNGQGASDPDLRWQDDGSSLHFPISVRCSGLINLWTEAEIPIVVNLTDSQTQMDAKLTREALEEYTKVFPTRPLGKGECKGQFIQLDDFGLVFEYATSQPKVHLSVKRFSILWDRGKIKSSPQGKSVRRHSSLYNLMQKTFHRIKSREKLVEKPNKANMDDSHRMDLSLASQAINRHEMQPSQILFMSQLPSHPSDDVAAAVPGSQHGAVSANRLLQHLGAPSKAVGNGQRGNRLQSVHDQPSHASTATTPVEIAYPRGTRHLFANSNEDENRPAGFKSTSRAATVPVEEMIRSETPEKLRPVTYQLSSPRANDSPSRTCAKKNLPIKVESPQALKLSGEQEPSDLRAPDSTDRSNLELADPWEGMTEIHSNEVTIPEDQLKLLDGYETREWFPPPPGEDMVSGFVPPSLLSEWNEIILRRSLKENEKDSEPTDEKQRSLHTALANHSPSAPETEPDSEEEAPLDWPSSPRDVSPQMRQQLPADSSPPRGESASKGAGSRRMERDDDDKQARRMASLKSVHSDQHEGQPSGTDEDLEAPPIVPSVENHEPDNEESNTLAVHEDHGHESDSSSEESIMDISVPLPFTHTPQGLSSQLEADLPSTEFSPSTSTAKQDIQVTETPAAVLHRLRPANTNNHRLGEIHEPEFSSSLADKSSSQSRILNTYASNDGDPRGEPSQESSKSLLMSGRENPNGDDALGTPIRRVVLPTQDITPWSQPGVWNSSGPKSSESNAQVPTTSFYQSPSSNPFSSYREVPPSSMLSVEQQASPSILGYTQGSSPGSPRLLSLKRCASDREMGEASSPSKRYKHNIRSNIYGNEKRLEEEIIARRQDYISSSTHSSAFQVYEKFQDDYPTYFGDFAHFTELCSRLQAFRDSGGLKRSFLWDDFIIKHLKEYPRYIEECLSKDVKTLDYAEYFASSFSTPSYKKRSLTANGISTCAAQHMCANESSTAPPLQSSVSISDAHTSFTSSLRDQLSNFHTHSFGPSLHERLEDIVPDSHTPSECSTECSIPDSEPAGLAAEGENSDVSMEGIHDTASIELGDEEEQLQPGVAPRAVATSTAAPEGHTPLEANAAANYDGVDLDIPDAGIDAATDTTPDPLSEAESSNENWFLSLRHLYATAPVWSDHHNTPFKKWALADQNVLIERWRRGGSYVSVDDKGVIQRDPAIPCRER